jgi:uncharacterized protein (TIGR03437 family)
LSVGASTSTTIHLASTGTTAPDKLITVTLQVVGLTTLSTLPVSPQLGTYIKGSGVAGYADVAISSGSGTPFFFINTATMPIWLTADSVNGTVPKSVRFSSTTVCDSLAPGVYTAPVHIDVSGQGDKIVTFTLLISNKAPILGVQEGTTRVIPWVIGSAIPTPTITAQSTDTPIAYTLTTSGTLAPIISAGQTSGLAYSFGTPINVTFDPLLFAAALPNTTLTGTVAITWGSPAAVLVVTITIQVQSPGALITALSPGTLPTALPGVTPFAVAVTGVGFVPSADPLYKTKVGIVTGGSIVADGNITVSIINPSNMTLYIAVNSADNANLPFAPSGAGGPVTIGVCNPGGGTCSVPTSTQVLNIGNAPIIQAVTSSASLTEVTAPTLPTIAPYDMVSLFGANFCSSIGTGCLTNTILFGNPDAITQTYPVQLSPDLSGTLRQLQVLFYTHSTTTLIGTAPLLFATNGQINALVPASICPAGVCPATVDIAVSFNAVKSVPFQVNVAYTDPGIFTIGADGQGNGAILDLTWKLITPTNLAGMRNAASGYTPFTFGDSDVVQLYMTGLGIPDSNHAGLGWSANCVTIASYETSLGALTGTTFTALDGTLILQSPLTAPAQVPCLKASGTDAPTVTIGGVAGAVVYAGWAPNEVAGLYQVNVQLPASTAGPFATIAGGVTATTLAAPALLPIVITSNSVHSQAGVSLWVGPKLYVVGPDNPSGLTGPVGASWPGSHNLVVAQDGTGPYTYAVTTGLLPSGVTLGASSGALAGVPAAGTAGTYQVTVTATDSLAMTGTVTFTLTVSGGLFLTSSGTSPYSGTYGTPGASVTIVTAASGAPIYTYSLTGPPAGVSIVALTGVVSTTSGVLAGSFHITAHAFDTTPTTPLVGNAHFDIVQTASTIATPAMSAITGGSGVDAVPNATVATVVAGAGQGFSGTPTFTMSVAACLSINSATGVISSDDTCITGANPSVTVTATDSAPPAGGYAAGVGTTAPFTVVII